MLSVMSQGVPSFNSLSVLFLTFSKNGRQWNFVLSRKLKSDFSGIDKKQVQNSVKIFSWGIKILIGLCFYASVHSWICAPLFLASFSKGGSSGGELVSKAVICSYREAYAQGKKERPPFVPREQSSSEDDADPIPDELLCPICNDLMTDAVVIPCCGNSYCDECESAGSFHFLLFCVTIIFSVQLL